MAPLEFVTNQEIIMAARRNLPDNVWHYLSGGAESETTMRRNRYGLDSFAFRPQVLADVAVFTHCRLLLPGKSRARKHRRQICLYKQQVHHTDRQRSC